jgi:predicted nucleotide-binding protein
MAKDGYIGALKTLKQITEDGDVFGELLIQNLSEPALGLDQSLKNAASAPSGKKVFIVHGHDHQLKIELEVFLSHIGLEPIVLHREVDAGKTIIEKIEANSDVAYVFILLTPDEIAYTINQQHLEDSARKKEYRARSNVIFEFGYFIAKLGRSRVCSLHKGDVVIPSDLNGFIYKKVDANIEDIGFSLIKELKAAGLKLEI